MKQLLTGIVKWFRCRLEIDPIIFFLLSYWLMVFHGCIPAQLLVMLLAPFMSDQQLATSALFRIFNE